MVSRERARHAVVLLKAMLAGGLLGGDVEMACAISDLEKFVEGDEMRKLTDNEVAQELVAAVEYNAAKSLAIGQEQNLAAHLRRLLGENAKLRELNTGHVERIAKQSELLSRKAERGRVADLEAALRPFADFANAVNAAAGISANWGIRCSSFCDDDDVPELTLGDCRRAASLLAPASPGTRNDPEPGKTPPGLPDAA